jgi:aspartate racemase
VSQVQSSINIPLLYLAEATAKEIKKKNLSTVVLLDTKYTMQLEFYGNKLAEFEIETHIPVKKMCRW